MKVTMIECGGCSAKISAQAATCPTCGHPNQRAKHVPGGQVLGAFVLVGVFIWWMSGGWLSTTSSQVDTVFSQVATDAVTKYEIAQRGGDKTQTCVQAGFVVAAFLQAKDEANYQKWLVTQKADCKAAGLPI